MKRFSRRRRLRGADSDDCLSTAQEAPKRGGILNFAVTAEPPNYDCHASQTFTTTHTIIPFYSFLVKFDPSQGGKVVGDLAKSWTISADGLVYTFKLHENVTFHDGRRSPRPTSRQHSSVSPTLSRAWCRCVSRIWSDCDHRCTRPVTVVFKLSSINVSMLDNLASPFNCVYSADKLKQDPKFPETNVMGSGAFRLAEYVRGSHVTGKRFEGYFRQGAARPRRLQGDLRQIQFRRARHAGRAVRCRVSGPNTQRARSTGEVRQRQLDAAGGARGRPTTSSSSTRPKTVRRPTCAPCVVTRDRPLARKRRTLTDHLREERPRISATRLRIRAARGRDPGSFPAIVRTSRHRAPKRAVS